LPGGIELPSICDGYNREETEWGRGGEEIVRVRYETRGREDASVVTSGIEFVGLSPDGEPLEPLLLVHHTHGGEHVVLEAVCGVELEGGL
jgi:hypothetical protein